MLPALNPSLSDPASRGAGIFIPPLLGVRNRDPEVCITAQGVQEGLGCAMASVWLSALGRTPGHGPVAEPLVKGTAKGVVTQAWAGAK